jgi:hypothetical protein
MFQYGSSHVENTQRPNVSGAIHRSRPEDPTWFSTEPRFREGKKKMVHQDNSIR